jgi:hypothetical protein
VQSTTSRSRPPTTKPSWRAWRRPASRRSRTTAAGIRQLFLEDPNGVRIELNVV